MQACTKCGETKPREMFSRSKQTTFGRSSWCKKCQVIINRKYKKYYRDYQNKYQDKRKRYGISVRAIQYLGLEKALAVFEKYNKKCDICGSSYDLTIHHIDGNGRHKWERGLPENNDIDNLQILCRRCHGSIHGKQGGRPKKMEE